MRNRAKYKSLALGGTALLVVGIVTFFTVGQSVEWVGHTDLEVNFVVTDINTGQPIPNVLVHVRAEAGGFCEETDAREFTITTDNNGCAKRLCKSCMCCGSKSYWEDTFAVYLPYWWFHVTAAGYAGTDPAFLDVPKNAQEVGRGTPATISVPINLRKTSA